MVTEQIETEKEQPIQTQIQTQQKVKLSSYLYSKYLLLLQNS